MSRELVDLKEIISIFKEYKDTAKNMTIDADELWVEMKNDILSLKKIEEKND